jgi:hypothetical protein
MFAKRLFSVLLIVILALPLLPTVRAQEGPTPEAIGLRPDAPPYACTAVLGWHARLYERRG